MMKKIVAATIVGAAVMASGQALAADGQKVYSTACFACHATGAAGAPKYGDKDAWAPRIEQGLETLHKHALEGFKGNTGYMPPKGGYAHLSDEQVKAAVDYMVNGAK